MPVSANTFFHYTTDKQTLVEIFRNGFAPSYCLECFDIYYEFPNSIDYPEIPKIEVAIPMICFCDIPLSAIEGHVEKYGSYGIGVTKEWGINNGLNPVFYMNPGSNVSRSIRSAIKSMETITTKEENNVIELTGYGLDMALCYTKPFMGSIFRDESYKHVHFYNEREWRYVVVEEGRKVPVGLSKVELMSLKSRLTEEKYNLPIKLNDIRYVIVEKNTDIPWLISQLKILFDGNNYTEGDLDLLWTKITSIEMIREDY